ncbi:MAG: transcription elongation factor GreA [Ruminococcus sp.]|nr:transcription elongation factor GreA [Ruminococcus sp.]
MAQNVHVSKEGYKKLEEELNYLVSVRRSEVAEQLKEARSYGDLSENAEYDEAKNAQALLEARINELEMQISNAVIVEAANADEISIGSKIKLLDLETNEIEALEIVGSTESDPDNGRISDDSPIGKAVLKKKLGDTVEIQAPIGVLKFEVVEISE